MFSLESRLKFKSIQLCTYCIKKIIVSIGSTNIPFSFVHTQHILLFSSSLSYQFSVIFSLPNLILISNYLSLSFKCCFCKYNFYIILIKHELMSIIFIEYKTKENQHQNLQVKFYHVYVIVMVSSLFNYSKKEQLKRTE